MKWLFALVVVGSMVYAGAYYYVERAIQRTSEQLNFTEDSENYYT